jgi:outer membrane protein insertion porin family
MLKRLTVSLLLILSAFTLYAQTDEDPDWYYDKPIRNITFEGLEAVSPSELEGITRPFIGRRFTDSVFLDLQRRLYALEFFERIVPRADRGGPDGSELNLVFEVQERPVVAEIRYDGNKNIRNRDLNNAIVLSQGDIITNAKIAAAEQGIRDLYLEKGYPDITVSGRSEKEDDKNVVIFTIDEGYQNTIREIRFSGNSFASESSLRSAMTSRAQSLFNRGVFEEANLDADRQGIESYYHERGYIDAEVLEIATEFERDEEDERTYVILTVFIDEGEQYRYGGMSFEGNSLFTDEELRAQTRLREGSILNRNRLEADFQNVADLYYQNGYIFNEINRREERDMDELTIRYVVTIVERDRARIENIILRGNTKTKDHVIEREIPLEVGDVFSATRIRQGIRNLSNLQYFSSITPDTPQGSAEGLMDLIVNLEEGNTAEIMLGVAFGGSADFPVSAQIRWQDRNFLGRGQTVGVETNLSPISQRLSVNFQERWLFGRRWSGGLSLIIDRAVRRGVRQDFLEPTFEDDDNDRVPDPYESYEEYMDAGGPFGAPIPDQYLMEYTAWNISIGGNTGYRWFTRAGTLGVRTGLRTGMEYIDYDRDFYRPYNPELRNSWQIWRFINRWTVGTSLDSRDLYYSPSTGYYLNQGVTFTGGPILQGARHYIRTDSKAENYITLWDLPVTDGWNWKMVLAKLSNLAVIFPWPENMVPDEYRDRPQPVAATSDLLYIDGMFNARGWGRRFDLEAVWNNAAELRMPLAENVIWLDGFLEGSYFWEKREEMWNMEAENWLFTVGWGVRFVIPQFPIRLYLVRRFTLDDGDIAWQTGSLFNRDGTEGRGWDFVFSIGTELF